MSFMWLTLGYLSACDARGPASDPNAPIPPAPSADAPRDQAMAKEGARWFRQKGCMACHRVGGGSVVGPDLLGVTRRREYDWFMGMVLSPDSMFRADPVAGAMLGEFVTPMPDSRVTPTQARAIYEFLRGAN